ncbi:MAG: DinB family protein [Cyclobacteriaceae bacterium]|jgi:uncharacterized damage-inducible protein DinB
MNRRHLIKTLGHFSPLAVIPSLSIARGSTQPGWLQEFSARWEVSEIYNREVFTAMPEEFLDYEPVPEVMSFGKQFSHLSMGISGYASIIRGDDGLDEPAFMDGKVIFKYMEDCSADFRNMLDGLEEEQLYSKEHKYKDEEMWKDLSIADILLLAYHHTAHHRGQAIVYLRLKGIEPPKYRF